MAIHYFHCTDGTDLIVDRCGRETRAFRDIVSRAQGVAEEVMHAVPGYDEWDNWSVHVYDARGEVEIVPFRADSRRAAWPRGGEPARIDTAAT